MNKDDKLNKALFFLEKNLKDEDMSDGFEEFLNNVIGLNKEEIASYNEFALEKEIKYPTYKDYIRAELTEQINIKKEDILELESQYLEIDNHFDNEDIKNKYQKNEKEMQELRKKFFENTSQDKNLKEFFREDNPKDRYSSIMVAGTILAGIDLRNLQRENNNLSGEKEEYPYSVEQIKLIDRYIELENEQDMLENQYEESDEEEM